MNGEILKKAGIDFDKGVARFLGDRQLFESVLTTFLNDPTFVRGKEALEKQEYQDLYECVHMLKGVAGNMDMTQLYQSSGMLCDYLRRGEVIDAVRINALFHEMEEAYQSVCVGIFSAKEV